jgi:hypothetical protein
MQDLVLRGATMSTLVHDALRMRSTRVLTFKVIGPDTIIVMRTGKEVPVGSWGGTAYGWFSDNAPAKFQGRKFLLRDRSVYLGPKPKRKDLVKSYPNPNSCPIRERTGDGIPVGRCYYHCPGDVCLRHGDVSGPLNTYRETGKLTDEKNFQR